MCPTIGVHFLATVFIFFIITLIFLDLKLSKGRVFLPSYSITHTIILYVKFMKSRELGCNANKLDIDWFVN